MAARDWWTAEFAEVKPLRIRAFLTPSFRVFIVLDTCRGVKANIILDGLMEKHYSLGGVQWARVDNDSWGSAWPAIINYKAICL